MTEPSNHRTVPAARRAWLRRARVRLALPWAAGMIVLAQSGWVCAGGLAWTQNRTSTGMHPGGGETVVSYERTARDPLVPPGARVTQVHASRHYEGDAQVETRLCWRAPTGPCVPFQGTQLNTHRFDGLSALGPFVLVHRVGVWRNAAPTLFVSGTVTVWFAPSPIGPERDPR